MKRTLGLALLVVACAYACGGSNESKVAATMASAPGGSKDPSKWPSDDHSMCDWRNKPELEVSETSGPGAIKPNIRRVYKTFGEGDQRHKTLACREVDTNLDGIKDTVRTFNEKGEALHEEADRNYDGKVDVWINFVDGRMSEEDIDTNGDGRPDVWKFYVDGQMQRIRRDRNFDGKPDVWEIYTKGKLERVGTDETYDGHVDRWDRDEQMKFEADEAERKAREKMAEQQGGEAFKDGGATINQFDKPPPGATKDAGAPSKPAPKTAPKKK